MDYGNFTSSTEQTGTATAEPAAPRIQDTERAKVMVQRHLNGESMKDIANSYNVTSERVRQIVRAMGVTSSQVKETWKARKSQAA
jgi:Mor family transcriptional regulator